MEIKRYDVVHPTRAWMSYEEKGIQEHPEGEFVRYEDHKAKCEELGAIAQSASDKLFKLIELMKPRPIDTAPKDGEPILVEHKTCGWMQGWPQSSGCHVPGLHGVVKWKVLKRWLPLPPEVKPWSDSPDQDKFIDMESKEVKWTTAPPCREGAYYIRPRGHSSLFKFLVEVFFHEDDEEPPVLKFRTTDGFIYDVLGHNLEWLGPWEVK